MSKTDLLEESTIKYWLTTTAVGSLPITSRPTAWWVGLFTSTAGESGGGTEVSGGAYARVSVTWGNGTQLGGTDGYQLSNTAQLDFPTATADWGLITSFGVFTASTSGTLLYYGALDLSRTVSNGDLASFAAGALKVIEK